MGVRIDGSNDVVSAADGTLTVDGLSLSVTGIITASGGFKVGSAYTAFSNGNVETTGIITASTFAGNNTFIVETAGSERLRITSAGRVGIGSDDPQNALDVAGDVKILDNSPRLEFHDANSGSLSNTTGGFETFDRSGNRATYVGAGMENGGNIIEFGTNNTFRAIIDSSGNVGINTASPTSVFDVQVNTLAGINFTNTGQSPLLDFRANNVETAGRIRVAENSGGAEMLFFTKTTGGTITESFRVDTVQRLLVGLNAAATAVPPSESNASLLQVGASNNPVSIGLVRSDTSISDGNIFGGIHWYGTDTTSNTPTIHASIQAAADGAHAAGDNPSRLTFSTTADGASSVTERLRITSAGHLLHGVTADEDTSGSGGVRFINAGDIQIDGDQQVLVFRSTNSTAQDQSAIEWWNENGAGVQAKIAADRTAVNQAPTDLVFYTSANVDTTANGGDGDITERLRVLSSGGLTFNGDTAQANALDDYEEGTFTPTVANFTVSGTTTLTGQYVKIGKQVTIGIKFANTGTIAHGVSAMVASLPFAMASGTEAHGLIGMLLNNNGTAQNSNKSGVQCKLDGEGGSRFFPGSFTTTSNGEQLIFGGTYIAAS